jgi:hypothetical protein
MQRATSRVYSVDAEPTKRKEHSAYKTDDRCGDPNS